MGRTWAQSHVWRVVPMAHAVNKQSGGGGRPQRCVQRPRWFQWRPGCLRQPRRRTESPGVLGGTGGLSEHYLPCN